MVPFERQGRVFGFAQSVEQVASPLTADVRWIGGWFGTAADRGMALVFVLAGLVGLAVTVAALFSGPYRRLSAAYERTASVTDEDADVAETACAPD